MLKILGILVFGVLVGWLFRSHLSLRWVSKFTMLFIYLLLFVLGIAVGTNEVIIANLHTIGAKGTVIALVATLGSMIMAKVLYQWLYVKKGGSNER